MNLKKQCFLACAAGVLMGVAFMLLASAAQGAEPPDTGTASFYGEEYRGRITAYGERFDPDALTCASWVFPKNAILAVWRGDRFVIVRVNDKGPAEKFVRSGRVIDLTSAAFRRLAPARVGLVKVSIQRIR